jgi:integrase
MARLKIGSVPGLRFQKASGKAVVTLSGQDHYCGPWGSKTAIAEFDRHVSEWLARGRRPVVQVETDGPLTLVEVAAAYKLHAKSYYRKNGEVTNEYNAITSALRVACDLYGEDAADDIGPLKLQAVQQSMIRLGWCRKQINKQIGRIVRMFAWAVAQEMVSANSAQALREVKGLHKGRTEARESEPVLPVDDAVVNATLKRLPSIVADMVRLQRLTGCRPEEVCLVRPCDIDRDEKVWTYRPHSHKTSRHGRARTIAIGPKGQDVLRKYLVRDMEAYCFAPAEGERKRRAEASEARQTPITYGNRPGSNRKASPKRKAGERYTTASYRRAITRACELAKVESWAPNRLRHSAATDIRRKYGLEAAQVTLGHAAADVTQVYAERDLELARSVMEKIG